MSHVLSFNCVLPDMKTARNYDDYCIFFLSKEYSFSTLIESLRDFAQRKLLNFQEALCPARNYSF